MNCQRKKFLLQRKHAYLDCAYMSPSMKKVEKAGIKGIKRKRKPHQITSKDFFYEADIIRNLYSQMIDCDDPLRTVIIPSVSYGMGTIAKNLPFEQGKIILANEQFPSNVYPWISLKKPGITVKIINRPSSEKCGEDWNNELLNAIDDQTKLISIGHIHWSDGTLFDLKSIRKKLDEVGGLLVIDGTQSIGALPFSVKEYRPDAIVCAGYKCLMAPYSIGLAYYGSAFDNGTPLEENWINRKESHEFSKLIHYQDEYREKALRYEVGERSNFILLPMLRTAIKQIQYWKPENIQAYCQTLMAEAINELKSLGYMIEDENYRSHHLFGIRLPKKINIDDVRASLKKYRVSVSIRGETIRVAPHVYNDEIDVKKLLKAMKEPIFALNTKKQ